MASAVITLKRRLSSSLNVWQQPKSPSNQEFVARHENCRPVSIQSHQARAILSRQVAKNCSLFYVQGCYESGPKDLPVWQQQQMVRPSAVTGGIGSGEYFCISQTSAFPVFVWQTIMMFLCLFVYHSKHFSSIVDQKVNSGIKFVAIQGWKTVECVWIENVRKAWLTEKNMGLQWQILSSRSQTNLMCSHFMQPEYILDQAEAPREREHF